MRRLFVLQCVSGPDVLMIGRALLSYAISYNLRTCAIEANRELHDVWLPEWRAQFRSGELPLNIVLIDFLTICPELVHAIVASNTELPCKANALPRPIRTEI